MARASTALLEATDEALVEAYRETRDPALFDELLSRHRSAFSAESRRWFIRGSETQDVEQELLIGFIKAVRDFDAERSDRFVSFAKGCVRRHVITAVRAANRDKHRPLTDSDRLETPVNADEAGSSTLGDTIEAARSADPAHRHNVRAELQIVADALGVRIPDGNLDQLVAIGTADLVPGIAASLIEEEVGLPGLKVSLAELEVFLYRLFDTPYAEIAERMGRDTKYVDNCFQRVRRKATRALEQADAL